MASTDGDVRRTTYLWTSSRGLWTSPGTVVARHRTNRRRPRPARIGAAGRNERRGGVADH
ncbi:MAG: hypothetical protein BGO96_07755 [Micrococcales bacterium 73-15]|nr:MAG: hypothetical protein BGO96_07755 [Micrococcales bacterium 73-15]